MTKRKIGQAGLDLIKQFEGYRLTAYKCPAGVWTIGYGHTADVKENQIITQAQADKFLRQDCERFEYYVNNPAYVPVTEDLNQNQFDALVSFAFNCGAANLKKLCVNRSIKQIAEAMPLYKKAAGKILAGLVSRRAAEVELFNTPPTEIDNVAKEEHSFYPAYIGEKTGLSMALNSLGINNSYAYRRQIATVNGITGYRGTAGQNTKMYHMLVAGQLKKV